MMSLQEDVPECPLCMETFELDDINFFPCTCGYQICRFCWHRIRTNETGLCPACRKSYPEDPVHFKPLSEDEVLDIKRDRRQKEMSQRQKSSESLKHLTNVRVVQKNLVFVVGLSQRLADSDILRRHEYFGKFGRIHKVVVNQSTSYVGSQGPSASAYVTYVKPEDAYYAIQAVNHLHIDHRNLKASLGTTKYCSQFLKGALCSKTECMYLHDLGDEDASFSKEDIQQGKHLQYEQKLIKQHSHLIDHKSSIQNSTSLSNQEIIEEEVEQTTQYNHPDNHLDNYTDNPTDNYSDTHSDNHSDIHSDNHLDNQSNYSDGSNLGVKNEVEDSPEEVNQNQESTSQNEDEGLTKGADLPDYNTLKEDLGFDPWAKSLEGLADMMETEKISSKFQQAIQLNNHHEHLFSFFTNLTQNPTQGGLTHIAAAAGGGCVGGGGNMVGGSGGYITNGGLIGGSCADVARASDYFSEADFYRNNNSLRPWHYEHMNCGDTHGNLLTSTTFPISPSKRNQTNHNLSWIQLHNNNNLFSNNNNSNFYSSKHASNINNDPAIITASILQEGNDRKASPAFLNFGSNKANTRHLHRFNHQLQSYSDHHPLNKLPPPGFQSPSTAEHHQLPAL